jgi:hypothetical protein
MKFIHSEEGLALREDVMKFAEMRGNGGLWTLKSTLSWMKYPGSLQAAIAQDKLGRFVTWNESIHLIYLGNRDPLEGHLVE